MVKVRVSRLVALLEMPCRSIPHQSTFERILAKLDAQAMEEAIGQNLPQLQGQAICISIDGKTLRGTITSQPPQGVHYISSLCTGAKSCAVSGRSRWQRE